MKFPYTKVLDFPKHQKRERVLPWIRLGISAPRERSEILYPLGLVDSGSDLTIVNQEFAEELGLSIEKGIKHTVCGVGGGQIDVYLHKVVFYIHDGSKEDPIIYQDHAAFAYKNFPKTMPQQTAILGTIGFFQQVDVTFRYPKEIVVEPKK